MSFVRIAVNVPAVNGEFDYHLPTALEGRVEVGHLVRVPFGPQVVQGVVIQVMEKTAILQTRDVQELLDPQPVVTPGQVELARQLSARTLGSLAAMLDMMLPPGLSQHADQVYSLAERWKTEKEISTSFPEIQKRLIALLQTRGALRSRQIDRHFERVDWRKSAASLVRQGVLRQQSVLPPPAVRPKFILTAQLAVPPEIAEAAMPALGKTPATLQRRQKALRFLVNEPDAVAVSWVYAESGCNLADLQELAERDLIVLFETEIFRDPLGAMSAKKAGQPGLERKAPDLTVEQSLSLERILTALQSANPAEASRAFLLHGVTGSGKTEIYLAAAAEAIRQGRTAIVMVPEIAITPQIVRRFVAHFPGQVGLVHSRLSDGERYDTWRRARSGQLKVIIGARSALFSPLPNLGLVVVDECHDQSYYQSDPPFYNAVPAAQDYARIAGAVCILGSATPSVELKYRSQQPGPDSLTGLELTRRFQTSDSGGRLGDLPPVTIVDMRQELKNGNRGIFSRALLENLAQTFERGEQAILYLNRRGTATYVFCHDCGHVVKCPNCDTPLTYHDASASGSVQPGDLRVANAGLICHRCGYTRRMPSTCPDCGSAQIKAYGLGSEKVESEVRRLLPTARTLRWDWETTREKDSHEMILTHFANHQADILIGTQMLAKGLDLPLVTLVGVVLADVGLTLPDPFTAERSFQLLTQVAGRAGRSERGGQVIMQTYMPENRVIQLAAAHDYDSFYQWELANRRELGYPPFTGLARLEVRNLNNVEAEKQARSLAERLKSGLAEGKHPETSLSGPVPCFFTRVNSLYRWQIMLRGPNLAGFLKGQIPEGWRVEVGPVSLL